MLPVLSKFTEKRKFTKEMVNCVKNIRQKFSDITNFYGANTHSWVSMEIFKTVRDQLKLWQNCTVWSIIIGRLKI